MKAVLLSTSVISTIKINDGGTTNIPPDMNNNLVFCGDFSLDSTVVMTFGTVPNPVGPGTTGEFIYVANNGDAFTAPNLKARINRNKIPIMLMGQNAPQIEVAIPYGSTALFYYNETNAPFIYCVMLPGQVTGDFTNVTADTITANNIIGGDSIYSQDKIIAKNELAVDGSITIKPDLSDFGASNIMTSGTGNFGGDVTGHTFISRQGGGGATATFTPANIITQDLNRGTTDIEPDQMEIAAKSGKVIWLKPDGPSQIDGETNFMDKVIFHDDVQFDGNTNITVPVATGTTLGTVKGGGNVEINAQGEMNYTTSEFTVIDGSHTGSLQANEFLVGPNAAPTLHVTPTGEVIAAGNTEVGGELLVKDTELIKVGNTTVNTQGAHVNDGTNDSFLKPNELFVGNRTAGGPLLHVTPAGRVTLPAAYAPQGASDVANAGYVNGRFGKVYVVNAAKTLDASLRWGDQFLLWANNNTSTFTLPKISTLIAAGVPDGVTFYIHGFRQTNFTPLAKDAGDNLVTSDGVPAPTSIQYGELWMVNIDGATTWRFTRILSKPETFTFQNATQNVTKVADGDVYTFTGSTDVVLNFPAVASLGLRGAEKIIINSFMATTHKITVNTNEVMIWYDATQAGGYNSGKTLEIASGENYTMVYDNKYTQWWMIKG